MKQSHTRRSFLKAGSALGLGSASGLILPSRLLGADSPSKKVNIALIGSGGRGSQLLRELINIPQARVIVTCDPFKDRREAQAGVVNGASGNNHCKPVEDFREVMADSNVDAVVVATPDHWHVPVAIAAAKAKKDMYVEKPLGLSMPRAAQLRDLIRANKLVFQYGTQQHSSLSGRQAVELVWNEYVGKIKRVDVVSPTQDKDARCPLIEEPVPEGLNYDLWLGPARETPYFARRVSAEGVWFCYDYALGFIAGWGAHPLDVLQWGLQTEDTAPVSYKGTGFYPKEPDLFDTVRTWDVEMQYANGMEVRFLDQHSAIPVLKDKHPRLRDNEVIWHGTEGFVTHTRGGAMLYRNGKYENVGKIDFSQFAKRAEVSPQHMQNFVDCVISRKDPVSTIEAALHSDSISHLSNLAVRSGKEIAYDPKTVSITNDKALDAMLTRKIRKGYEV
ncbi:MAG: Gfo/Idh/MocA family oxidoreductase [Verrucomicrobiota bacterium]